MRESIGTMKISNHITNFMSHFFVFTCLHIYSIAHAYTQKTNILNLATMHVDNAIFELQESIRFSKELNNTCAQNLFLAQNVLKGSQMMVLCNPNHAYEKLIQVQNSIYACIVNINNDQDLEFLIMLKKIEQSLIHAENLIRKNAINKPFKDSLQGNGGNKSDHLSFYNKNCAPTSDHSNSHYVLSNTSVQNDEVNENFLQSHHFMHSNSITLYYPIPPTMNIMMDDMIIDYCSNHISFTGYNATICLDRGCGGRFHSRSKYSSGVFTVQMRAPSNASGVSSSFYISSNDMEPDIISFDVIGNLPKRVLTTYAVNGSYVGTLETFHMEFDTSLEFHEYTIKWDADSIIWMIDKMVLRTLKSHRVHIYPRKPGYVFGYIWDASHVAGGNWAGRVEWKNSPFFVHYNGLQVMSPLNPKQWRPPLQRQYRNVPTFLQPILIENCASNIAIDEHVKNFAIAFDQFGCGGRIRSLNSYTSGKFKARIKCSEGDTSGLLTSMYLSSGEGTYDQDEIDFEFLGNNKRIVQTNFYGNGSGGHELWVNLNFDCSEDFHTYAIFYNKYKIQWFVDSNIVRTVFQNDGFDNDGQYPKKRMFLYVSLWNASWIEDGMWTGKWHGKDMPYVAKYSNVTIQYP